jgi:hypothetical protein
MRVKITHSIDLEDVSEKASELVMPVEDNLSNVLRWLGALGRDLANDNITAEMTVLSLDRIRRSMGKADATLAEVEGIMQGVAAYKKQQELPPIPAGTPPATSSQSGFDELEVLAEEIARDKERKEALAKDMLQGLKEKQDESPLPF